MKLPTIGLFALTIASGSCNQTPADAPKAKELATPVSAESPPVANDPLIVHEWGTFTTLQGATGGSLDGLQHETEALPHFVYSRTQSHKSPFAAYGDTSLDVPVKHVGSKMETPVIYFYSKTPRTVRVHVDFTHGLLTQWYPNASAAAPALAKLEVPLDVKGLEKSSLDWTLTLSPERPAEVPHVEANEPWSFARETNAAWVRNGSGEAERYVFYRGLGRMDLPIVVNAYPQGPTLVHNCSEETVAGGFVLEMRGGKGRFVPLQTLTPHKVQVVSWKELPLRDGAEVVKDLEQDVAKTLVAQGLFADEARAMVRTWSPTWFASEGTRVIYMVPTSTTERVLPLQIEPKPDTLVRVLVGRHEFLTREAEKEVVDLLKDRMSSSSTVREGAMKRLARLGRFLEPTVRRVIESADPLVQKSGKELLAEFQH